MRNINQMVVFSLILFSACLLFKTQAVTYYYGDPSYIQKLVTQAVESGFTEVKFLIDRQFWFMLIGAKYGKYTFKIKPDWIQYRVNYTSPGNVFVFDLDLNKTTWKPQLKGNRTYKVAIVKIDPVPIVTPIISPISSPTANPKLPSSITPAPNGTSNNSVTSTETQNFVPASFDVETPTNLQKQTQDTSTVANLTNRQSLGVKALISPGNNSNQLNPSTLSSTANSSASTANSSASTTANSSASTANSSALTVNSSDSTANSSALNFMSNQNVDKTSISSIINKTSSSNDGAQNDLMKQSITLTAQSAKSSQNKNKSPQNSTDLSLVGLTSTKSAISTSTSQKSIIKSGSETKSLEQIKIPSTITTTQKPSSLVTFQNPSLVGSGISVPAFPAETSQKGSSNNLRRAQQLNKSQYAPAPLQMQDAQQMLSAQHMVTIMAPFQFSSLDPKYNYRN